MPEQDHSGSEKQKPMVVFAGRSNVGKSSVMRALTGRRLKVGKRPGTTRWEKSIDLGAVLFVDTPGFGHMAGQGKKAIERAKTALVQKLESWSSRLVLTVLIIDISLFRELVERWENKGEIPIDVEFYTFLSEISKHVIVVANKIDKLPSGNRATEIEYLHDKLPQKGSAPVIVPISAKQGTNIVELRREIERVLQAESLQMPTW